MASSITLRTSTARSFKLVAADGAGELLGVDARAIERLADIDVAKAGDDVLVKQRGLHRRFLADKGFLEISARKLVGDRFRSHTIEGRIAIEIIERPEIHEAEAAGVVEGDSRPALHVEDDMIVFFGIAGFVMELAGLLARNSETGRSCRDA
jgi:hypothetical protein